MKNISLLLFLLLGATSTLAAQSAAAPGSSVSAVLHEGMISFRVDHAEARSIEVRVFNAETDQLLFDSGPRRGTRVDWGFGEFKSGAWRSVIQAWNADGVLIVSQTAKTTSLDQISSVAFDSIPPGTKLKAAGDPIVLGGDVEFGPTERTGKIADFYGYGGRLDLYDEEGYVHSYLSPDTSGIGGRLAVTRNASSLGFLVDGNSNGTQNPKISMSGSTSSAVFDMSTTGNDAVVLPVDAVASNEILDEPGLSTGTQDSDNVELTVTTVNLVSQTIFAPTDGYVIATAQGFFQIGKHTTVNEDVDDVVSFGISTSASTIPSDALRFIVGDDFTPGYYFSSETAVRVFPVTGGYHTFYFNANLMTLNNATAESQRAWLALLFVPTAYGTITVPDKRAGTDGWAADFDGQGQPGDVQAKGVSPEERCSVFNKTRIRRELEELQQKLQYLQTELDARNEPTRQ